jgi:hypothetical protein
MTRGICSTKKGFGLPDSGFWKKEKDKGNILCPFLLSFVLIPES